MDFFERDFHDGSSSFDEILDFDIHEDDEEAIREERSTDIEFYRSIEEY